MSNRLTGRNEMMRMRKLDRIGLSIPITNSPLGAKVVTSIRSNTWAA